MAVGVKNVVVNLKGSVKTAIQEGKNLNQADDFVQAVNKFEKDITTLKNSPEWNTLNPTLKQQILKQEEFVDVLADIRGVGNSAKFSDELLEIWAKFDDNVLDVASVGKQNWKTFQNRVAEQLQSLHPGKKIGNQITLDVTYTLPDGSTLTKTIIPDNLIQFEVNGIKKYKVIDAKTSQTDLVNKIDLTSTCTKNQQPIYKMIDGDNSVGTITKVEMRGGQAKSAFQSEFPANADKIQINLENNVEFWVNTNNTVFTEYLIRPRIK